MFPPAGAPVRPLAQAAARASQQNEIRARRREGEEEDEGDEEEEEEGDEGDDEDEDEDGEGEAEGDEDRDAAPHGPRCMDPTDPATQTLARCRRNGFSSTQPGKQRLKIKTRRVEQNQQRVRREGGGQTEAATRVQMPLSYIETQSGKVYWRTSPLGI